MSCIETITINVYQDTLTMMIEEHKTTKKLPDLLDSADNALNEAKRCVRKLRDTVDRATLENEIRQNLADHCVQDFKCKVEASAGVADTAMLCNDDSFQELSAANEKKELETLIHRLQHRTEPDLRILVDINFQDVAASSLQCKPCFVLLDKLSASETMKYTQTCKTSKFSTEQSENLNRRHSRNLRSGTENKKQTTSQSRGSKRQEMSRLRKS